jgi:hypothetical protein
MAGRLTTLAAGAAAALAAVGCSGGANQYAGMSEYEARSEVLAGMARELQAPRSPLYDHRVRLLRVVHGAKPGGEDAWVGMFADSTTGGRVCVRVSQDGAPFRAVYDIEIDRCDVEPEQRTTTSSGV